MNPIHPATLARAKAAFVFYKPRNPGEAVPAHAGSRAGRARPRLCLCCGCRGREQGMGLSLHGPTNTHLKKYPTSTTKMITTSTRISSEVSSSLCKVLSSVESGDGHKESGILDMDPHLAQKLGLVHQKLSNYLPLLTKNITIIWHRQGSNWKLIFVISKSFSPPSKAQPNHSLQRKSRIFFGMAGYAKDLPAVRGSVTGTKLNLRPIKRFAAMPLCTSAAS